MKSVLTLVGGSARDQVISQTALAAAQPLAAHLDFLHIHVTAGEAARYSHAEFARGAALRNCLEELTWKAHSFSRLAARNVHEFCADASIEICDAPVRRQNVTANFHEEKDRARERLTTHARHSDLVVIGRARQAQGLPPDTLERLILQSGRPILVAATAAPQTLTGTVMVCWKESDSAARAVAAATPLLTRAKRVVFTTVVDRDEDVTSTVSDVARRFARNDVETEARVIAANGRAVAEVLAGAAEDCGADLVVMGAYGRSRVSEILFGSHTDDFIRCSDRPTLLVH
jgi:nucleotide-binding universal stress UspA family protein